MLTVDFDPDRPRDEGQYHVRLIDPRTGDYGNDPRRQSQLGYWCDRGHLESGVLRPILVALGYDANVLYEHERMVATLTDVFHLLNHAAVTRVRGRATEGAESDA